MVINTNFRNIFLASLLMFITRCALAQTEVTDTESLKSSIDRIISIKPHVNTDSRHSSIHNSLIPDEVQKALPEAVKFEKRFYPAGKNSYRIKTVKIVDQQSLVPVLVESIKEQQAEIERLKSQVEALKIKE